LEKAIENYNKAIETDTNNINALFSRGACYNKLGYYQKAIDDYYLALDKDTNRVNRKGMYRNINKVLGLNQDENEKSIGDSSYINGSKLDGLNIESDIHEYVYNSLKDDDIKKSINDIGKSLNKPDDIVNVENPSGFIQIKKVEYNNKILDNFDEKADEYSDLRNPFKREEKRSKDILIRKNYGGMGSLSFTRLCCKEE
jgi:tetratricopeptide (TPR) repeat protein